MADDPGRGWKEASEGALARILREQQRRELLENPALLDQAVQWLQEKWGNRPCPYCGHIEWEVGTPLEIGLSGGEAMSPTFPVMCGNCGQTAFVNAILAGLLPEPER